MPVRLTQHRFVRIEQGVPHHMTRIMATLCGVTFLASGFALLGAGDSRGFQTNAPAPVSPRSYLGFDRNVYPGDAALRKLRETFSYCGYWLNAPPGETATTWQGKRETLDSYGFGFLVLFNGRLDRELKTPPNAKVLGTRDAVAAIAAAKKEGFPPGTVIFLDQEEGGRMLPEQRAYVYAWVDGVNASGYRAGVYCSGMPVKETRERSVVSASDLQENAEGRSIIFFVYNDACPPSPGCAFPSDPPSPQRSGVSIASVWQFAQSPRRREFTSMCPARYNPDGNCYPPSTPPKSGLYIDVDSALSSDPSSGRR